MKPASSNRRRIRNPLRLARTHWLYSLDDITSLYGVSRNTITNWKKAGLKDIGDDRLIRGCDLNQYHTEQRIKARRPCERHEVFCMHCELKHSLLVDGFSIGISRRGHPVAAMICPETQHEIRKYLSQSDIDQILQARETRRSAESQDYTASPNCAAIVQKGSSCAAPIVLQNEQAVYDYQMYLKEALGRHVKTIDTVVRSIRVFQAFAGPVPFERLSRNQIAEFKDAFENGDIDLRADNPEARKTSEGRGSSTIVHCFGNLQSFFAWLRERPGYRKIKADLPSYFRASRRHVQIASAAADKRVPTPEEIRSIIAAMPIRTRLQRRDRALMAFLFLSGMRDGAVIGLKLKHVDVDRRRILQDPREIETKNAKSMRTSWFPVGDDIAEIVTQWVDELRGSGADDEAPLFPKAWPTFAKQTALLRWKTATPLRKIVKTATQRAGIAEFRPHAIRATVARLGDTMATTFEEQKAWSQNLGHEHIATTANYYAKLDGERQAALISSMWSRGDVSGEQKLVALYRSIPQEKREALLITAQAMK